jgi:hypothetical protein
VNDVAKLTEGLKTLKKQLGQLKGALHEVGKPKNAAPPSGGDAHLAAIRGFSKGLLKKPVNKSPNVPGPQPLSPNKARKKQLERVKELLDEIAYEAKSEHISELLTIKDLDTLDYVEILGKNADWSEIIKGLPEATKLVGPSDLAKWNQFIAKITADKERATGKK